ncbi:MAG TPA: HD domain-containing phosphohydrolase [Thermoanaerobaculia bacterium]|nr:HD domain-containing phosphohydrolase [Thermoanaerobaculia bacterium]
MNPEVKDLQPKLKEVLYDCAVEIRATKAALFLYDSIGRYEIVAEYGFKGAIRQSVDRKDPIVDRCGRGRSAFFVNGLSAEPRFSEVMYESSSDRLLAAPIYSRGQLVGLIDMRDKAQKQLFDNADLPKAQKIAERIAALFAGKNVFGQRFISLAHPDDPQNPVSRTSTIPSAPLPSAAADVVRAPVSSSPPKPSAPPPAATVKTPPEQTARVPRLSALIIDGRAAANRIVLPPAPESLTENELAAVRDVLRAILLIPSVAVVSFAAFGHMGGIQEVAAKGVISEEASAFLQSKLNIWLAKRGESAGHTRRNVQLPFGPGTTSIQAAQMVKVFTAPVVAGSLRSLYLTVAFTANPDRNAHELLAAMLTQLQAVIERSMDRASLQSLRERAAFSLIEPDFAKYPELRAHSELVASRCESLARYLEMSPAEIENVRIAALVHDVGMRLLDYDRLYRKPDISLDEIHILREHTTVGAALVEPVLGHEIARAVLCHHERWDGSGYPNELGGEEIPRMARIIHVCDVYESMIATENYKPAQPRSAVLTMIAENGGTQFDAAIANRFIEMVR